jgi:hypothetical protein
VLFLFAVLCKKYLDSVSATEQAVLWRFTLIPDDSWHLVQYHWVFTKHRLWDIHFFARREFWGFHSEGVSSRGLLDCGAMYCCGRIPTFRRSTFPPSSLHPEYGGSLELRNVGILPQRYTASQPKRPSLETSLSILSFNIGDIFLGLFSPKEAFCCTSLYAVSFSTCRANIPEFST